jgi:hypothetical protein
VFLLLKPFLEIGKKTFHLGGVVRVDDMEICRAMYEHVPMASDWIHGGGLGKKNREMDRERALSARDMNREMDRYVFTVAVPEF